MAPLIKGPTISDAPTVNVLLIKKGAKENEIIMIGPLKLEVLEDGSNTDNRIGATHIYIPPHTPGPPQHWHQMHDETFLTLKGICTFTSRSKQIKAGPGDYVVVPPCSPHTFSNEEDEEAIVYNTFTPAFYVNYFRLMAKMIKESGNNKMTPEISKRAMSRYATIIADPEIDWDAEKDGMA